jgi:adenylosuccinate lyase
MKGQRDLGVPIPAEAIKDYEKVKGLIDLAAIAKRERITLHDVKARIEEFSDLAKRQFIHLGLTSRDLTENVEQLQVFRSLKLVHFKAAATLLALAQQAEAHRDLMITGRTHNVPAQPTTFGKRLAMFGQEMLIAFIRIEELLARYPVRGLKGAVGTQLDQLTLLGGDSNKVDQLETRVLKHLGFRASLTAVGQVYPRSLDFEVTSALHQLGAAAASCATTLRLMAGAGLLTEGFQEGQVGSSAMPHKVNARNCERICGFSTILSAALESRRFAGERARHRRDTLRRLRPAESTNPAVFFRRRGLPDQLPAGSHRPRHASQRADQREQRQRPDHGLRLRRARSQDHRSQELHDHPAQQCAGATARGH